MRTSMFEASPVIPHLNTQFVFDLFQRHHGLIRFGILGGIDQQFTNGLKEKDRLVFRQIHIVRFGNPHGDSHVMPFHILGEPCQPGSQPMFAQHRGTEFGDERPRIFQRVRQHLVGLLHDSRASWNWFGQALALAQLQFPPLSRRGVGQVMECIESFQVLVRKKKRGNLHKIKPLIF